MNVLTTDQHLSVEGQGLCPVMEPLNLGLKVGKVLHSLLLLATIRELIMRWSMLSCNLSGSLVQLLINVDSTY